MLLGGSSPKMAPAAYSPVDSRPLTQPLFTVAEVASKFSSTVPASNVAPPVYEVEEIEVSAKRVPWWAWALAGGVGFIVLNKLLGGR